MNGWSQLRRETSPSLAKLLLFCLGPDDHPSVMVRGESHWKRVILIWLSEEFLSLNSRIVDDEYDLLRWRVRKGGNLEGKVTGKWVIFPSFMIKHFSIPSAWFPHKLLSYQMTFCLKLVKSQCCERKNEQNIKLEKLVMLPSEEKAFIKTRKNNLKAFPCL